MILTLTIRTLWRFDYDMIDSATSNPVLWETLGAEQVVFDVQHELATVSVKSCV